MGCGASKSATPVDSDPVASDLKHKTTPASAKMTFAQMMEKEVPLQQFIDWYRTEPSRDTNPGRKLLKALCGTQVVKKKLGITNMHRG
jgi:hypothetical protein